MGPVTKPKIADPVPLDKVDVDRQKEYGGLTTQPTSVSAQPLVTDSKVTSALTVTDEDKKEFVRAILGGVPFGKTYVLYDAIKVSFLTRTVQVNEKLFDELKRLSTLGVITTDDDWDRWKRRFKLLTSLSTVVDQKSIQMYSPPKTWHEGPWDEAFSKYVMSLPSALYTALLITSDTFEDYVDTMMSKADSQDFWKTAGRS